MERSEVVEVKALMVSSNKSFRERQGLACCDALVQVVAVDIIGQSRL